MFTIELRTNEGVLADSTTIRTGIRTIVWVQDKDKDGGVSLYAKVNGRVEFVRY
jgi:hypothetical protein